MFGGDRKRVHLCLSLLHVQEEEEDEEALAEKFSEAFNQIDIDSEGSIVAEQLGSVLECLGMVRVISVSLGSR